MQNWAYTITKCTNERDTDLLIQPAISDILINAFIWCKEHARTRIGGFAIMPDHYHIILALRKDYTLSSIMATIDSFTARKINSYLSQLKESQLEVAPTKSQLEVAPTGSELKESPRQGGAPTKSQLEVAPTTLEKRQASGRGQFWERGYYDHAHRSAKDFIKQLDYIHNNPVRKELVDTPDEWPFSTANPKWSCLIDWDWFKP